MVFIGCIDLWWRDTGLQENLFAKNEKVALLIFKSLKSKHLMLLASLSVWFQIVNFGWACIVHFSLRRFNLGQWLNETRNWLEADGENQSWFALLPTPGMGLFLGHTAIAIYMRMEASYSLLLIVNRNHMPTKSLSS